MVFIFFETLTVLKKKNAKKEKKKNAVLTLIVTPSQVFNYKSSSEFYVNNTQYSNLKTEILFNQLKICVQISLLFLFFKPAVAHKHDMSTKGHPHIL